MKRRDFLRYGSAGIAGALVGGTGLISWTPRAHAQTISKTLYITNGFISMPDFTSVYFMGYSDSSSGLNVPATPVIVQQGDTINLTIHNTLSTPHSFKIDGVVDSGSISGGSQKSISFQVNNPGTFMFYDGVNVPYNRICGLHGALAVMPSGSSNTVYSGSPTFVHQQFWVHNDIDPNLNDAVRRGVSFNSEYIPRYFTLNGQSSRPPGAPGHGDPTIDAMSNHETALHGSIGDRTLVRNINAGQCTHAIHVHGNHMEWLTSNGQIRSHVWKKDILRIDRNGGVVDFIYPFEPPPDAWPPETTGCYPMHLHDEMSQTSGGGSYMFGAMTDIYFE